MQRPEHAGILKNIKKHITLEKEEADHFSALLTQRSFRKKEIIQKSGKPCEAIHYVDQGVLRAFYRDRDDNESIVMFAVTDWWITDMHSFLQEKPAMLDIDALEDSVVLQLRKADLDRLYADIPKLERFFRILMQNAYVREQLRVIENLSLPAEARYNNFLKKYPQFAQRVPLKQIASYLGITPEFLSVLRKKAASRQLS